MNGSAGRGPFTATILRHFPSPILDDLVQGRWLPVVGAGMWLNARTPAARIFQTG